MILHGREGRALPFAALQPMTECMRCTCGGIDRPVSADNVDAWHRSAGPRIGRTGNNELTVEFTVLGQPFVGLNGGPAFTPNESVSFMVLTETQDETDRYWDAILSKGGTESDCGWCKDRWGHSWKITPRRLLDLIADPDRDKAKRAMTAMMTMQKIDIATIKAAAAT